MIEETTGPRTIKSGQVFVWAFEDDEKYYAHVLLALEDSGVKRDGDWKFRVKVQYQ